MREYLLNQMEKSGDFCKHFKQALQVIFIA